MKNFIHDHINQIAMLVTGATTIYTNNLHDAGLAALISSAVAYALKSFTPKP